jgi:hypothetical protein
MPNLDDMRIAAKSLHRLAELMEADVRKEEGRMAGNIKTIRVGRGAMHRAVLTVRVKVTTPLKMSLRVSMWLMRLAAFISGYTLRINEEEGVETALSDRMEKWPRAELLIDLGRVGKRLHELEMADLLTRQEQDERDNLRMRREQIRYEIRRRDNGW